MDLVRSVPKNSRDKPGSERKRATTESSWECIPASSICINNAGIKIAKKGYIDGGNNLVFMVTDGAFNKGSKSYMSTIQMAHETKNIKFSVVGIKTGEYLGSHLTSVAEKGGGTYVRIITIDDAQNKLFEEVKRTSLIKD